MEHLKGPPESNITPSEVWEARRRFLELAGSGVLLGLAPSARSDVGSVSRSLPNNESGVQLVPTPERAVTHYNNYYEFSFEKEAPAQLAGALKIRPWTLEVRGLVEKPLQLDLDELIRRFRPEHRIYRFRCVEGWSAILPWTGIALKDLLLAAQPLGSARFVSFTAVEAPEIMPNQKQGRLLEWPYQEGLRLDEAMHPLTLIATGLYGKPLSPQNGAPLRLVVPWKYGFKSIKALVRIELTEQQPKTTWNRQAPSEYGFYANVNPDVPHPRWSQATERPLASALNQPRSATQLFNGYGEQVANLYAGLDLKRFF